MLNAVAGEGRTRRSTYDVIIIGGGILGQAVAHELARDGTTEFLHVYPAGFGRDCASAAAGAMISAFGEVTGGEEDALGEAKLGFRASSQDAYPEWLESVRDAAGLAVPVHRGIFMIANAHGRADGENLARLEAALERFGRRSQRVPPDEIPGFAPDPAYWPEAALFVEEDFSLDSVQLLSALVGSVARCGRAHLLDDVAGAVSTLPGGRWQVETAGSGRYQADELVLCAGAHIPELLGRELLPQLSLPSLYFAKGIGVVVSGAPAVPHAIRTPNRSDACGVHIVPRADGRLYIGASTHYGHATAAARGVTPGEVTAILGDTLRQIDARLRDTTIEEVRFGLRPLSDAGVPLVGRTALPGLSLATGTFRTGIVMAPLIARLVADAVLGRASDLANPWALPSSCRVDPAVDNLALYHLNLGLRAYQDDRLHGRTGRRADARDHWHAYLAIAGADADPRIVALLGSIEKDTAATRGEPAACL